MLHSNLCHPSAKWHSLLWDPLWQKHFVVSLEPFQNTAIVFSLQKIPCSFRVSLNLTSPLKRGQFFGTSIEIFSSWSKIDFKFFTSKTVSNSFSQSSESLLYCYIYKLIFDTLVYRKLTFIVNLYLSSFIFFDSFTGFSKI